MWQMIENVMNHKSGKHAFDQSFNRSHYSSLGKDKCINCLKGGEKQEISVKKPEGYHYSLKRYKNKF